MFHIIVSFFHSLNSYVNFHLYVPISLLSHICHLLFSCYPMHAPTILFATSFLFYFCSLVDDLVNGLASCLDESFQFWEMGKIYAVDLV